MISSYPGLYSLLIEELKAHRWEVPLWAVEESIAGGVTHSTVGEIVAEKWNLGKGLCTVIRNHHDVGTGDPFSFLVGVANILGQVLYPLPEGVTYPLGDALATGELKGVAHFLPQGFFDQNRLSSEELVTLVQVLAPTVKRLSEEMRSLIVQ